MTRIPAEPYGGAPIHPGEILKEDFLSGFNMTAYALSKAIHVPQTRLSQILACDRAISADTALRLGRFFGTTPQFWLNLQASYEIRVAQLEKGSDIERLIQPVTAVG